MVMLIALLLLPVAVELIASLYSSVPHTQIRLYHSISALQSPPCGISIVMTVFCSPVGITIEMLIFFPVLQPLNFTCMAVSSLSKIFFLSSQYKVLNTVRSFYFAAFLHANSLSNCIDYIIKCISILSAVFFNFPCFQWVYILI